MSSFNDLASRIANFYAGKPVSVGYANLNGVLGTTGPPGSNTITLSPQMRDSIQSLIRSYRTPGGAGNIEGLGTLIHEALHTRGADGDSALDPQTGLYSADDEWQAHQLSYNLVADAMQRFFGVDPNSKLGQRYIAAAQGRGYGGTLGSPQAAGAKGYLGTPRVVTWG